MTDALPIPAERLLQETQWLRALAASLAGPDEADDLAQTAWLRALEQRPERIRGLRPWLRTVLGHALERSRQSQRARVRRELAASRPEAAPSTADLVARASLHRTMVDAVLSLDEPGRSTVLLRFFDDCPPREIARRQGVPVETVRTRLRRALATLRERLDGEMGSRERWISLALPGGLLMSLKTQIAVVVACTFLLTIGIGVAWRTLRAGESPAVAPAAGGVRPPEDRVPASHVDGERPAAIVSESSPTSRSATIPSVAHAVRAQVHVSNVDGCDVPGALVVVTPFMSPEKLGSAVTDVRGGAVLELAEARIGTIRTTAEGFAGSTMESVAIVDGGRIQVDLIPLSTLRVRVTDPSGASIAGAAVQIFSDVAFQDYGPSEFQPHVQLTDDTGTAEFHGVPTLRWRVRIHATGYCDAPSSASEVFVGPSDTTVVLQPGLDLIVDFEDAANGAPVPGVRARISPDLRRTWSRTQAVADEHGNIAIGRAPDATSRIEVTGSLYVDPQSARDPQAVDVPPGQRRVKIRVSPPPPVACRVTREDGTVIERAILETAYPPRLVPMEAEEGLFRLAGQGVATSPYFRFVVHDGATPWRRVEPWRDQVELVVHASIRITGQVVDPGGRGVPGALINIDARNGPTLGGFARPLTEVMTTSDDRGFFSAELGANSTYLIEVATSDGPCARHIVTVRGADPSQGFVAVPIPFTRLTPGQTTCDVGRIVVPTATGTMRVKVVDIIYQGPCEVVATPLGANSDRFPALRATIRSDRTAEIMRLPEGEYDVTVMPRGELPGFFGFRGARVRIVGGELAEVTLPR